MLRAVRSAKTQQNATCWRRHCVQWVYVQIGREVDELHGADVDQSWRRYTVDDTLDVRRDVDRCPACLPRRPDPLTTRPNAVNHLLT